MKSAIKTKGADKHQVVNKLVFMRSGAREETRRRTRTPEGSHAE